MRKKNLTAATAIFIFAGITNSAYASELFSMDGTVNNKDNGTIIPLDEMHIIVKSSTEGTISLKDEANPLHGASGSCSGTMLIAKGQINGGGYCTYKDADGDSSIVSFTATAVDKAGVNMGDWELVGGTGKYASANGSGKFSSAPNADRTASVNTISGEFMPK